MTKIIECVPNISEGKNQQTINEVSSIISSSGDSIKLLDVDAGSDTNRTVYTFVGNPKDVEEAAFQCIKKSYELIDMSNHSGAHPRQGCTDVCPFIPVANVSMDECIEISKRVGKRVGDELGIPVYLYGYSASSKERSELSYVRKGEYESLKEKLPVLNPDFGSCEFNDTVKKSGAVNISARDFLIAYNINLNTRDSSFANEIALNIREGGRVKKDENGKIVKDENGKSVKIPGLLKSVKGIGWYIDEYGIAQISVNLLNYNITPIHKVFETCVLEAEKLGVRVTGSEIVGLIPKESILETGRYYLQKSHRCSGIPEKELIHIAIKSLGLSEISVFKIEDKIIEYKIKQLDQLCSMKLNDFIDEVSKDSPAPGGGSVAALAGSLGAGLGSMVATMTSAKSIYKDKLDKLAHKSSDLIRCMESLKIAIDTDTIAFNDIILARRMSKGTPEEKEIRNQAIQQGYKTATLIPLETARLCVESTDYLRDIVKDINPNSVSDVGVGILMAYAAFESAVLNIDINVSDIEDINFKENIICELKSLRDKILENKKYVLENVKLIIDQL